MLRRVLLAAGACAGLGANCPDAPAALDAFPPAAPAGAAQVGLTTDGVGRARFDVPVNGPFGPGYTLGNGVVGLRAKLSTDGGATFFDAAPLKVAHTRVVVVDGLDGAVDVALVGVTNLGIESPAGTLLRVEVPADRTDVDAPPATTDVVVRPGAGGVALTWSEQAPDTFAWDVFRSCDGGAPVVVARIDAHDAPGFFDVAARGTCAWHVVAEDLSGNRSADSNVVTGEVL